MLEELKADLSIEDHSLQTPESCLKIYFVNQKLKEKNTPCYVNPNSIVIMTPYDAAKCGRCDQLQALKNEGANLSAVDQFGWTPAHYATKEGRVEVLEKLGDLGANFNVCPVMTRQGWEFPVHLAIRDEKIDALKVLCKFGAALDVYCAKGWTPVRLAVELNKTHLLKELRDLGANLNFQDKLGKTPAHYAAEKGNTEALKKLKELGANLGLMDHEWKTPIDLLPHSEWKGITPRRVYAFLKGGLVAACAWQVFNLMRGKRFSTKLFAGQVVLAGGVMAFNTKKGRDCMSQIIVIAKYLIVS